MDQLFQIRIISPGTLKKTLTLSHNQKKLSNNKNNEILIIIMISKNIF